MVLLLVREEWMGRRGSETLPWRLQLSVEHGQSCYRFLAGDLRFAMLVSMLGAAGLVVRRRMGRVGALAVP